MQISGYGAIRSYSPAVRTEKSSVGEGFQSEIRDQVSLSQTASAGLLSASEKQYFNKSFGLNVFAAEGSSSGERQVVSGQAASVLNQQEISYFETALGSGAYSYTRAGRYGRSAAPMGAGVNRMV